MIFHIQKLQQNSTIAQCCREYLLQIKSHLEIQTLTRSCHLIRHLCQIIIIIIITKNTVLQYDQSGVFQLETDSVLMKSMQASE